MSYGYIKIMYGSDFTVGQTVYMGSRRGRVTRCNKSQEHYVQVLFDGQTFSVPVHPMDLHVETI